jgi:2-succinyl-6-hydroxy-2,4-cyclohexadiene-1-carboxylate synthase
VLATQVLGRAAVGDVPLALVHGFTQTGRSWGRVADRLAESRAVVLVDAPGHGGSAGVRLDLAGAGRAVVDAVGRADLLGYSMGGRICLHAALHAPDAVGRLVLVGATAGIVDPAARARRRADDEALADAIEQGGDAGLPAFLERWLQGPLFATLPADAAGLDARRENTAAGLASSLRLCGTGAQQPLDDRLGQLPMPVLLVVGERDDRFRAEAERLRAGIASAEVALVEGAGHACHLERPDAFLDVVEGWLTKTEPGRG